MARQFTRREFIQISSATAGAVALGASGIGCRMPAFLREEPLPVPDSGVRTPTWCEICFWQCAGWVYTENGVPQKVIGNEIDPHCYGRFCPRGTGGIGAYLDDQRLRTPLIRVAERGKQVFREATWEEAIDKVAAGMRQIVDRHGPEGLALFSHGSGGSYFKHLLNALGSNNITAPSYGQCRGPREEAYTMTFGETVGSPERTDLENARCIVLIGSHIGENMHNLQVQEFSTAVSNGASVIVVDPRFSTAASKAKWWLPIRPSTDIALLLAWIHVLLEEGLYDKDYVARYCTGLEELRAAVAHNTPEWAYPITTIKPHTIRETAREMARFAPATLVHPGRFSAWYGDDTQRARANAILNALLGAWGRKGGFYIPLKTKVPNYPYPPYPEGKATWRLHPEQYPLATSALADGVCDASIPSVRGEERIRGWLVYGTNLPITLPQPARTYEAIQHLDLLVAIDLMPAEITGWADVVLPECSYLERYDDLRITATRTATIALRMPAAEPRFDSKPGWWMAKEIANRLSLGHYFPWTTIEEMLDTRLKTIGSSLEEMQRIGVKEIPTPGHRFYFADGEDVQFPTPSGKVELYSRQLATMGFDPVPRYTAHPEPPPGYYRLLFGRTPTHTFGRTTNNPILCQTMRENEVWIARKVAKLWGIKNGDYLTLRNQDGATAGPVRAKVTERIRHDCVFLVHGFGHSQPQMPRSYQQGANDNALVTRVNVDPLMGATGMRVNFVTFEPAAAPAGSAEMADNRAFRVVEREVV
ncbi:MAG TPA: molybdopterin-dependent oxidoreductase [bacterium]